MLLAVEDGAVAKAPNEDGNGILSGKVEHLAKACMEDGRPPPYVGSDVLVTGLEIKGPLLDAGGSEALSEVLVRNPMPAATCGTVDGWLNEIP